jgi:hypothetical protein
MRNFALIIISMLMVSAILFSATTIRPALAQPPTGMFLVPQDTVLYNAEVGTTFGLNVSIANVTNFVGLQWTLSWNSSLVNCTGIAENLFNTVTPAAFQDNIWKIVTKFNNTLGTVEYGRTYQEMSTALSDGYAPINITTSAYPEGLATAMLNFTVTLAPPVKSFYECDFNFDVVNVGDTNATNLNVTGQNGHYRIYGPPETTETTITWNAVNYTVTTVTNATFVTGSMTFENLSANSYKLEFSLVGTEGDTDYVNVTIPRTLMDIGTGDTWNVTVNGDPLTPVVTTDENNTYIYVIAPFTLSNTVDVLGTIPEYALLFIPLLMASTLVAFALRRRRKL